MASGGRAGGRNERRRGPHPLLLRPNKYWGGPRRKKRTRTSNRPGRTAAAAKEAHQRKEGAVQGRSTAGRTYRLRLTRSTRGPTRAARPLPAMRSAPSFLPFSSAPPAIRGHVRVAACAFQVRRPLCRRRQLSVSASWRTRGRRDGR